MVNECWECRFYVRYGRYDAGGECHRYAPRPAMVKDEDPIVVYRVSFPVMDSRGVCGEWVQDWKRAGP